MNEGDHPRQFVVCIKNEGYPASLEVRKLYAQIVDAAASQHQLIRVVDESGEDYLYPEDFFMPIDLSQALTEALEQVA